MWIFMVKGIPQHLQGMQLKTFARKNDVYLCACDVAQGTRKFREALCTNLPLYFTADPKSHILHSSFLKLELQVKLTQWLWEISILKGTILSICGCIVRGLKRRKLLYTGAVIYLVSQSLLHLRNIFQQPSLPLSYWRMQALNVVRCVKVTAQ